MKLICISDTHGLHNKIIYPKGEILIISGDITERGNLSEAKRALDFFSSLDYQQIILIAGNHDFCFENNFNKTGKLLKRYKNIIYLNDSGIEINGFKIWGSPVQPIFYWWAFNKTSKQLKKHWNMIPEDTDMLITHTPPYSILDKNDFGQNCGCVDLYNRIQKLNLKYHIFGHIHESYGRDEIDGIKFINCSILDENYIIKNKPVEINI